MDRRPLRCRLARRVPEPDGPCRPGDGSRADRAGRCRNRCLDRAADRTAHACPGLVVACDPQRAHRCGLGGSRRLPGSLGNAGEVRLLQRPDLACPALRRLRRRLPSGPRGPLRISELTGDAGVSAHHWGQTGTPRRGDEAFPNTPPSPRRSSLAWSRASAALAVAALAGRGRVRTAANETGTETGHARGCAGRPSHPHVPEWGSWRSKQ